MGGKNRKGAAWTIPYYGFVPECGFWRLLF